MAKIATLALGLLLACAPGSAANTNSDNGKQQRAEPSMSAKKNDDSAGPESSQTNQIEKTAFHGREEAGWVYHLSQAKWHTNTLKEKVLIKLANAIEERGWTQTKTAEFLGVSQPRISDIMRGQYQKFTLDALVEMLYALDKPVTVVVEDKKWGLSTSTPVSNKEIEDAVAYYTKAIQLDPKNWSAYFRRADAYRNLQQYELAIGDYTRCIELDPSRPGPRSQRAMTYAEAKQYKAAIHDLDDLERLFPEYNVYQNRGIIYATMGEYDKALADDTKAVNMDPQRPGPWWNRACLYEKLGKFKEAISDYESTLKADPTYKIAQEKIDELKKKL
jgi:tetratricopeptide (TPR) repeat protein